MSLGIDSQVDKVNNRSVNSFLEIALLNASIPLTLVNRELEFWRRVVITLQFIVPLHKEDLGGSETTIGSNRRI